MENRIRADINEIMAKLKSRIVYGGPQGDELPEMLEKLELKLHDLDASIGDYLSNREDELAATQKRLMFFIEKAPAAIAIFDSSMNYLAVSERYIADYHLEGQDIIGRSHYEVFPDIPNQWKKIHRECLNGATARSEEDLFVRDGGSREWIRWEIFPWSDSQGNIRGIILFSEVITKQKLVFDALTVSEEKYRLLFELMPSGVVYHDASGNVIDANKQAQEILGLTLSEMKGRTYVDPRWKAIRLDGSDFAGEDHPAMVSLRTGKEVRDVVVGFFNPVVEKQSWINVSAVPLFRKNETRPHQVFSTFEDITDKLEAGEKIKNSEERFRKIFENLPVGMALVDKSFTIVSANPAFCRILGYGEEELKNMTFLDFTHPEEREKNMVQVLQLMEGELPKLKTEQRYVTKDGNVIKGSLTVVANFDAGGHFMHNTAMLEDVTDKTRMMEALMASEERLRQVTDQSKTVIWEVDADGLYTYVSQLSNSVWGYSPEELVGRLHYYDIHPEKDREAFILSTREVFGNREYFTDLHNPIVHKSGDIVWMATNGIPLIDETGNLIGYRGADIDISERRMAIERILDLNAALEREITEANLARKKAEESDRLKSAFLANMSHEIRTPLNAILGFTRIVNEEQDLLPDQKEEYLSIIDSSAENLLRIINDILEISKLETGQIKIEKKEFDVTAVLTGLRSICLRQLEEAGKKQINIELRMPDDEVRIVTDETRFNQVFMNLLSNSVKFTERGTITYGVSEISSERMTFFVTDTGIGIRKEHQNIIFERFRQAETTMSRNYRGTGLGLAIVKNLVGLMGGSIMLESEEGKGTTFTFELPV